MKLIKFNYNKSPLKVNLTIWYMIILLLVLIFFSSIAYLSLKNQIQGEVKDSLELEMNNIKNEIQTLEKLSDQNYLSYLYNDVNNKNHRVIFYDEDANILIGEEIEGFIPNQLNDKNSYKIISYENQDWAVIIEPYYLSDSSTQQNNAGYIMIANSLEQEKEILNNLLLILTILLPITLLLASGGGYFLSNRALKPIDIISNTAEKISHSSLSQRIKIKEGREDEIGRLINTLNNLLMRLETSFHKQKQFTADVSHELRTPISVIKSHIEEALEELESDIPEEEIQLLQTIKKQVDQMDNMISQMLMLARVDEENFELDKENFDLNIVVDAVMEEMNLKAADKNIKLTKSTDLQEDYSLKADLSLITQLLLNLIDNAVKYTPAEGKIEISLSHTEEFYRIDIADNGIGIKEEELDSIFNRFYRVDKSRSREYGGTGLGLSICRWIVDIHGGKIYVESSYGEGTTFSVFLPVK